MDTIKWSNEWSVRKKNTKNSDNNGTMVVKVDVK